MVRAESYRQLRNALIFCKKIPYDSRPYDSDARPGCRAGKQPVQQRPWMWEPAQTEQGGATLWISKKTALAARTVRIHPVPNPFRLRQQHRCISIPAGPSRMFSNASPVPHHRIASYNAGSTSYPNIPNWVFINRDWIGACISRHYINQPKQAPDLGTLLWLAELLLYVGWRGFCDCRNCEDVRLILTKARPR